MAFRLTRPFLAGVAARWGALMCPFPKSNFDTGPPPPHNAFLKWRSHDSNRRGPSPKEPDNLPTRQIEGSWIFELHGPAGGRGGLSILQGASGRVRGPALRGLVQRVAWILCFCDLRPALALVVLRFR